MTVIRAKFKSLLRAVACAALLGAGSLAAPTVLAQDGPAMQFELQLPSASGQQGVQIQQAPSGQAGANSTFGYPGPGHDYGYDDDWGWRCLTNREVREGIADYGFWRVRITRELRNDRVEVTGQYGNWLYSMRVDKCTGEVGRVQRVSRVRGGGGDFDWDFPGYNDAN